jgi:phosphatidylserine/phosphatidylglycerophosphate/cardiolipin synthase-like enzyme
VDITILTRAAYFEELARSISHTKAGGRVALASMVFDTEEPVVARIADELAAAAARGVTVYLAVDARVFLTNERTKLPGPLWSRKTLPKRLRGPFRSHRDTLEKLAAGGVKYAVVNQPSRRFRLPQAGRSHIKAAVIGDNLYIGGSNLEKPDDIDGMLGWRDRKTADWLYEHLRALVETGHSRIAFTDTDERHVVDGQTEILLDAGKPGQSIILDEALRLIDRAQKWIFFTCQYVPHGVIADRLARAEKRGVEVAVLFNHPGKHATYEGLLQRGAKLHERLRLLASYFRGELPKSAPFLHGKLLATDRGTMLGSHNYIYTGVRFGTAELAVLSRDPELAKRIVESINRQVGRTTG